MADKMVVCATSVYMHSYDSIMSSEVGANNTRLFYDGIELYWIAIAYRGCELHVASWPSCKFDIIDRPA